MKSPGSVDRGDMLLCLCAIVLKMADQERSDVCVVFYHEPLRT